MTEFRDLRDEAGTLSLQHGTEVGDLIATRVPARRAGGPTCKLCGCGSRAGPAGLAPLGRAARRSPPSRSFLLISDAVPGRA
jgi:hypothetical protein